MNIVTDHFHLKQGRIILIHLTLCAQRYLLLWAAMVLVSLRYYGRGLTSLGVILAVALLAVLLKVKLDDQRRLDVLERSIQADDAFLNVSYSDGTLQRFHWQHFKRAFRVQRHCVLFLSSASLVIVPYEAFRQREDLVQFFRFLKNKKLLGK